MEIQVVNLANDVLSDQDHEACWRTGWGSHLLELRKTLNTRNGGDQGKGASDWNGATLRREFEENRTSISPSRTAENHAGAKRRQPVKRAGDVERSGGQTCLHDRLLLDPKGFPAVSAFLRGDSCRFV